MRATVLCLLLCGCGAPPEITILPSADLSGPRDAAGAEPAADLAEQSSVDLTSSAPPDLATAPQVDAAQGPHDMAGCLSRTYLGTACTANNQCCGGTCAVSQVSGSGLACCYPTGTNCLLDSDCCGAQATCTGSPKRCT